MLAASGQALQLDGITGDVDAVADAVALIGGVGLLKEIGDVLQDAVLGEGQVLFEDLEFLVLFGEIDQDLRLQAGVDVFGQFEVEESSFMVVTRRKWGWALILTPATMLST